MMLQLVRMVARSLFIFRLFAVGQAVATLPDENEMEEICNEEYLLRYCC